MLPWRVPGADHEIPFICRAFSLLSVSTALGPAFAFRFEVGSWMLEVGFRMLPLATSAFPSSVARLRRVDCFPGFCFSFTATQPGFSSRFRPAAERARGSGWWEIVQRAGDTLPALLNHMRVNHRGGQIGMSQQFLDGADVRAPLQQVRCEAVPEGVRADYLGQSHASRRHLDRLVDHRRVHVMPPHHSAARVRGHSPRGKQFCQLQSLAAPWYLRSSA